MSRARDWIWTFAAVAALAGLLLWGWLRRDEFTPVEIGAAAPGFELTALDGDTVALEDYRGKAVLLNFWATWCAPCREEMPALQRLQQRLGPEGLEVVGINVDAAPGEMDALARWGGDVQAFVREHGLSFDVLLDPEGGVMRRYGVTGLPTTILLDREGRVVSRTVGAAEWDSPEHVAAIRAVLED